MDISHQNWTRYIKESNLIVYQNEYYCTQTLRSNKNTKKTKTALVTEIFLHIMHIFNIFDSYPQENGQTYHRIKDACLICPYLLNVLLVSALDTWFWHYTARISFEFVPTDNRRQRSSQLLKLLVSSATVGRCHLKKNNDFQFSKDAGIDVSGAIFI